MSKANHYAFILAGGRGTRFWPRSRTRTPKQILDFVGEGTLIQQTVARLAPVIPPERIWILTNEHVRDAIVKQLPGVPKRQILAEPAQRNTAPCIGLGAHLIHAQDPDAVMGVFPADHVITKPPRFQRIVRAALKAAEKDQVVVAGIQPRWPETGYGYIEFEEGVTAGSLDARKVLRFREKPDAETAARFVAAGNFFWNSGMFFWKASLYLDLLRRFLPRTATLLAALPAAGKRTFSSALAEAYPHCENISVDYAVLEKAGCVTGIPAGDFGWNDVGSWNAVWELLPKDAQSNVIREEALTHDSQGNFVDARGKLVALLGVHDLVIVDTPDALLVADRSRAQQVGELVKQLEKKERPEFL